jgi:competence protein ComEA
MLKSFFNLTKKERKASMLFLIFISILFASKYFFSTNKSTSVHVQEVSVEKTSASTARIVKSRISSEKSVKSNRRRNIKKGIVVTSLFDPNDLTAEEWGAFGMSAKQSNSICKFIRSKGGLVNSEELMDVYVLSKEDKETLVKWSNIKKGDLNTWTKTDFERIRGIGEVLSIRVIKFRDKLGGFYSSNQLNEIYGLDSTVIEEINKRVVLGRVATLAINKLSYSELLSHPYIGKVEAKHIIRERTITPFYKESQLFEVFSSEDDVNRLIPYVSYE